jgi:hypothetical protein
MGDFVDNLRLALVVGLAVAIPQAAGYAGYRFLVRGRSIVLRIVPLLLPAVLFWVVAFIYWSYEARALKQEGLRVCGMFGMAAGFTTFFGTLFNLIVSVLGWSIFLLLLRRQRKTSATNLAR